MLSNMQILSGRLPIINSWIDETISAHERNAVLLGELPFKHLPQYVSDRVLSTVKVVVTDRPPRPPMARFGFAGLDRELDGMAFGELEMRGATLDQMFFISNRFMRDEQFPFHFMIHSLQWEHMGRKKWIFNYAHGVFTCGRANTWAEKQARRLQRLFANTSRTNGQPFDAEKMVREQLDALMSRARFPYV